MLFYDAVLLYFMFAGGMRCEACFNNFRSVVELDRHIGREHRVAGKHFSSVTDFKTKNSSKTPENVGVSNNNLQQYPNLPIYQEHIYFPKVIFTQ